MNNFDNLSIAQRVKVKGKLDPDGTFIALEIGVEEHEDSAAIIGMIESIDYERRCLRVLQRDFIIPVSAEVKDIYRNDAAFTDLRAQSLVKLKGDYSATEGLRPDLVKMKETFGFNIDKLKGRIDALDHTAKTLQVNGYTVAVSDKTTIEGV